MPDLFDELNSKKKEADAAQVRASGGDLFDEVSSMDGTVQAQQQPAPQIQAPIVTQQTPLQPGQLPSMQQLLGQRVQAGFEPLRTLATSAVAEPAAGLAGLAQAINPLSQPGAGAQAVEDVRRAITVTPESEAGKQGLATFGEAIKPVVEPISKGLQAISDFVYEKTGSPALAAATATAPTAIAEIIGLGALRKVRAGTQLIDDAGRPTKALSKALNKQGLTYENLTPEAKKAIPNVAPKALIPSPKAEVTGVAENALVRQIKSGARDDALAGLKVVGNTVQVDRLGQAAIKQGFEPGFVQAVKTATPQTKRAMDEMLTTMERITKNRRLALETRPTDVVGNEVLSRVNFIRDKANSARIQLNDIAKTQLKGKPIDPEPVLNQLTKSLDDIGVSLEPSVSGIPKPVFTGSMISKDRTSQRVIKDLIDLMGEGGAPDALRFHEMKRQLDAIIDFRKKSAGGLTDAGKNVLKDVRTSLNQSLRASNQQYADVNDVLSTSLTSLQDFEKAVGPSIDVFAEGANKAIGTDLRGLLSNRKTRINLDNALNGLDETATTLGGKFDVNYKDLSLFANGLEDRFGAVAKTSFQGGIESAIGVAGRAAEQGATAAAREATLGAAKKFSERLRGVNDYEAFQSMRDLIRGAEK